MTGVRTLPQVSKPQCTRPLRKSAASQPRAAETTSSMGVKPGAAASLARLQVASTANAAMPAISRARCGAP
ncbi:MAG TPA: hypothetical protein VHA15_00585 [Burkholderiales bacterium]|jgi:hypothetical protein|nr:hypothetical protein [Burkholderiales bacterium]